MKKITVTLLMFVTLIGFSQEENTSVKNDSIIKTEVIDVITTYAPKVSDAFKIKRKPVINFGNDFDKKKLEYNINSAPVASTFVPKPVELKPIEIAEKERLFNNYIAIGFGNYLTPTLDAYFHDNTAFEGEYGFKIDGIYTQNPIASTKLNSSFSKVNFDAFYKEESRYFNWTAGFLANVGYYNFYGLPKNINYTERVLNEIEETQLYKSVGLYGQLDFEESYFKNISSKGYFLYDEFESSEINTEVSTLLAFPLGRHQDANEIYTRIGIDFLANSFAQAYNSREEKNNTFANLQINPFTQLNISKFDIKLGAKGYFSMDLSRKENKFYIYPDIELSHPIVNKIANIYIGATGDLHKNTFKSTTSLNPYISPTLNSLQTNEKYNVFAGLKGSIVQNINYNLKGSFSNQENKSLFKTHQSKSNGTNSTGTDAIRLKGYEYGNSFDVIYDDVKTLNIYGEILYNMNKEITIGININYNKYNLKSEEYAWNLPNINAEIFGNYDAKKWFAGVNMFYVGTKKGVMFNNNSSNIKDIDAYIDLNINGGYHINPLFTVFIKGNNLTNGTYQRFNNFESQGFQVIGGIIYNFNTFF